VQLACASYKFAWHTRPDPEELAPREMQEGSLSLADVRWLRAQWLLARTLCAALFHVGDSSTSRVQCGKQRGDSFYLSSRVGCIGVEPTRVMNRVECVW